MTIAIVEHFLVVAHRRYHELRQQKIKYFGLSSSMRVGLRGIVMAAELIT